MQRMTDALSRMLNDPSTRRAMRTLGDREVAATRNYQRSQTNQQLEEGDEPNLSDDASEDVRTDRHQVTTEPGIEDNIAHTTSDENKASQEMDESTTEAVQTVPDITIQGCCQNMDTRICLKF